MTAFRQSSQNIRCLDNLFWNIVFVILIILPQTTLQEAIFNALNALNKITIKVPST